jgi:hypothetical protein
MNERIKQLAVEADFMLCEDGHFYSEGQSQKTTDGLQKFAELIVRECAQLVKSTQLTEDGHTWRSADYVVLEHFGVKSERKS